ncbi:hypothetical protein [Pseudoalteromonas sp. R3]|uniref:hypothetical protein n=1 Tax=Pseudoalteromonas sp. R3 TaxID=1709477 RepID=UPI0006B4953D|nr:hypothetical protein [Pseudoalteromonas sp. R3]AZZ96228.1 hypothetical protein ELR70_03250 [Pseudoalteromonas sp. R3]
MKQLPFMASALCVLLGAPTMAQTINFDKLEVGYKRLSNKTGYHDTLTGVELAASKRFDNYYVEGRYYSAKDSHSKPVSFTDDADNLYTYIESRELDVNQFTLGAGYIHELDETSLFDVSVHIGRFDQKSKHDLTLTVPIPATMHNRSSSYDEDIYRLRGQYQTRVLEDIELKAGLGYEKTSGEDGDSDPFFFVGAGYHFNNMFSVNTEYRKVDDYNTLDINFRYSF